MQLEGFFYLLSCFCQDRYSQRNVFLCIQLDLVVGLHAFPCVVRKSPKQGEQTSLPLYVPTLKGFRQEATNPPGTEQSRHQSKQK